jgi:hypothetical protein
MRKYEMTNQNGKWKNGSFSISQWICETYRLVKPANVIGLQEKTLLGPQTTIYTKYLTPTGVTFHATIWKLRLDP